jgi:predicted alpha/beta superfamily hydrolase
MNLKNIHPFESRQVPRRNVDIWLPPDYEAHPEKRYPVLYMHDGQNLFNPALSFSGVDWGIDPALRKLMAEPGFRVPIVVGIWNTSNRLGEYMPEAPWAAPEHRARLEAFLTKFRGEFVFEMGGDAYLAFLVEELKPWVDAGFRTLAGQADTNIAGSSMGGLISLYAVCRYPAVFCGAGCVSTAWHFDQQAMLPWFRDHLPRPESHRLYFDMGGKENVWPKANRTLLRRQAEMDDYARARGYRDDQNLLTRVFQKAKHHESAWRERVDEMIEFLVGQ